VIQKVAAANVISGSVLRTKDKLSVTVAKKLIKQLLSVCTGAEEGYRRGVGELAYRQQWPIPQQSGCG